MSFYEIKYNYNPENNEDIMDDIIIRKDIDSMKEMCKYIKKKFILNKDNEIYSHCSFIQKLNILNIKMIICNILNEDSDEDKVEQFIQMKNLIKNLDDC